MTGPLNRLTKEKQADGSEVSHVYDAVGQRTTVKALDSPVYDGYDAVGRMQLAEAPAICVGTAYYRV